jgi:ubiquitin-conjugating enzyme E2 R
MSHSGSVVASHHEETSSVFVIFFEGGIFHALLTFPKDYPFSPPALRFTSPCVFFFCVFQKGFFFSTFFFFFFFFFTLPTVMGVCFSWFRFWHPNVYKDGRVCISILHTPDPLNPSEASHCWSPVQRVETILLSVISMLSDPNTSSPANVDASVEMRKDPAQYTRKIKSFVEQSKTAATDEQRRASKKYLKRMKLLTSAPDESELAASTAAASSSSTASTTAKTDANDDANDDDDDNNNNDSKSKAK